MANSLAMAGMGARLLRLIRSPWLYAAWGVVATSALVASYLGDPYVFGFTTLILGGASIPLGIVGVLVAMLSREMKRGDRVAIVVLISVTTVAFFAALATLRTFKWN